MVAYTIRQTRAFTVLYLSGRLTHEDHRTFAEIVSQIAAGGDRHVILDVGSLTHIDSSGFGMLVVANEMACRNGGEFRIRHASAPFKELAERTHASQIMKIA
ncbi:MAG: STAS domain-containing protein [Rhodospirillaceae bacterium]